MNWKSKIYGKLAHTENVVVAFYHKIWENIARIKSEAIKWRKGRRKSAQAGWSAGCSVVRSIDTVKDRTLFIPISLCTEWWVKYTELYNKCTLYGSNTKQREKTIPMIWIKRNERKKIKRRIIVKFFVVSFILFIMGFFCFPFVFFCLSSLVFHEFLPFDFVFSVQRHAYSDT